ncbi:PREDICTED: LOW QUALITY PROTEIN: uncharacterized protein CXorf65 homolog [Nipponia nippon]|uniref:LOW QUALITY PROTEIN: uncharacterized protein CXorf65 homolog n=1 Tax=Nipponia nippon TaxID=128390 RepID=UPI00051135DF|nr:PREDICTED: LOW QUALITY PROTEIN: uncharacterized protein CXorf65 homolog [Nipponia nippon]
MFIYISHGNDQNFLANTNCTIPWLLSYMGRMVGVPNTDVVDLCDELDTPKLLFQLPNLSDRASEYLQARSTYAACRVQLRAPGTEEEHSCWSFAPLLEHPSPALTGGRGDREQWGGGAQAWGPGAGAGGYRGAPSPTSGGRGPVAAERHPEDAGGEEDS